MANQLGEATIAIRATLDKLDGDLAAARGKVEGAMSKIGGSVQALGKVALAGVAGAAIAAGAAVVGFAAKAIPAASNLNEALNATNVVFGDAAATVQEFGKTAAESAGLSEAAFNQMAAQTGAMLQNYGLDTGQAADATILLAQRAADMASIFNTDVSDAMTAINAAMRGEADPIERFGVSMNAAAVEAQALAMGFVKVDGAFSQTELTQARLALLMQQTDKIAGDFVNTSGDLANATRINQARWENFLAQIGQVGLPIMGMFQGLLASIGEQVLPIVTSALETIQPVVEKVAYAIGKFVENIAAGKDPIRSVADLLATLAVALGGNSASALAVREAFAKIVEAVQGVIDAVAPYIEMARKWIAENIELNDVFIALAIAIAAVVIPAILSVVAAAAPIVLTFAALVAAVALVRTAWENNWGGIQEKTQAVMGFLQTYIPAAIAAVRDFIAGALETIAGWWDANGAEIIQTATDTYNQVRDFISNAINTIKDIIGAVLDVIAGWWDDHGASVVTIVTYFIDRVRAVFDGGMKIIKDLVQGVLNTIQAFWDTFGDAIIAAVDNALEFVKSTFQNAMDFIGELVDAAADLIAGDWEGLGDHLTAAAEIFWEQIKNVWETALENLSGILQAAFDGMRAALEKKVKAFTAIGKAIVDGIRQGVQSSWDSFLNWIGSKLGDSLIAWVKKKLGISSPSKAFMEIGLAIAAGLAAGIRSGVAEIVAASQEAINVPLLMAEEVLSAAGKLGSIGSGIASRYSRQFVDPTKARLDEMNEALERQRQQMIELFGLDPNKTFDLYQLTWSDDPAIQRRMEIFRRFGEERNEAEAEYLRMQERLAHLQEQQANVQFLQQQLDLLKLITENGLDVGAILGGLQLGLDADMEALIDAMVAAMQALIAQAEDELEIASPSKVFKRLGEQVMAGLAGGITSGVDRAIGALSAASRSLVGGGQESYNNWSLTINEAGDRGDIVRDFAMLKALSGA